MNELDELKRRFRELAEVVPQQAGDPVKQRVLAAFRAHHSHRRRMLAKAASIAALATMALGLYIALHRHAMLRDGRTDGSVTSARDTHAYDSSGFVPLPYAQSGVPLGEAVIMRLQLPVSGLSSLGVPVQSQEAGQRITADVLVGQDGVARAVRFVE